MTRTSWRTRSRTVWSTPLPGSSIGRSRSPAGPRGSGSTGGSEDAVDRRAYRRALPPGKGARTELGKLRGAIPERLGRAGCAQPRQGQRGRIALLPLVVPDGCMRQLRDEGERHAEAHVRDVPLRLRAGSRSRGTSRLFPRRARPPGGPHRFRAEAEAGEALDHPQGTHATGRRGVPPDSRSARYVQAVQHVHQLPAVLLRMPHLWARAELHRSRGHRPGPTVQHGLAGPGSGGTPEHPPRAGGHVGVHLRRRVHEGLSEARRSRGRHSAVQAYCRDELDEVAAASVGLEMSVGPHYTLYHPRWYRRRVSVWWWLQNWSYTRF